MNAQTAGLRPSPIRRSLAILALGTLACVTGVSGSGKSTLVHDVLYAALKRAKGDWDRKVGALRTVATFATWMFRIVERECFRLLRLRAPRIALYQPWTANMDEGWTRWLLEQWGFPYTSLLDAEVKAGKLGSRYDVIILPADGVSRMTGEREEHVVEGGLVQREVGDPHPCLIEAPHGLDGALGAARIE